MISQRFCGGVDFYPTPAQLEQQRKARRLHVGKIPVGVDAELLRQFIGTALVSSGLGPEDAIEEVSALNPELQTLNPQPEPETCDPQPQTPNPQLQTLNPDPHRSAPGPW